MKKKILGLILAAAMVCSLAACGSTDAPANDSQASAGGESTAEAQYTVGVCQLMQHVALDAATQGFQDALDDIMGEGVVKVDVQNAQGDSNTCSTITNSFVSQNVDLIMANATPALQAAAAATADIPILGTSVTEYGVALGIEGFDGLVGGNISGTSDLAPLDQQAEQIKQMYPDAKNVGLLYCSAEANSQYQVDTMKSYLETAGYTCEYYAFSDSNDLNAVVTTAAANSDLIFVPTDNQVASNAEIIQNVCAPAKVPVYGGDEGICGGCGTVTICVAYYDIGYKTGEMAAQILKGEANISEMPIAYSENITTKYNVANCEALGVAVPEGAAAIEVAAE